MTEQAEFSKRLLTWWDQHGRHDLPWQHPRTPYRVWVSEIMLQQTQVATVIPYFERFIRRFPTLDDLAEAPLDEVLALWAGLGYYARARNLHRTAKICTVDYNGDLPSSAETLTALPGIGESTANAIVSQAHDIPATVLDGNVRRVLARYAAIREWTGKPDVTRQLWKIADCLLPSYRGADYTQAIMDLGATICTRSQPACAACPVRDDCQALSQGLVSELPIPKARAKAQRQDLYMLLLTRPDGSVLLERRPPAGIWGGLWCLPEAESPSNLARGLGLDAQSFELLPAIEHRLTHRLFNIQPVACPADSAALAVKCNGEQRWFTAEEWPKIGLPRPALKLLELHLTGESQ